MDIGFKTTLSRNFVSHRPVFRSLISVEQIPIGFSNKNPEQILEGEN